MESLFELLKAQLERQEHRGGDQERPHKEQVEDSRSGQGRRSCFDSCIDDAQTLLRLIGHSELWADYWSKFNLGCGAGTQISGAGSGSRHLMFVTPATAQTSKSFWLRLK